MKKLIKIAALIITTISNIGPLAAFENSGAEQGPTTNFVDAIIEFCNKQKTSYKQDQKLYSFMGVFPKETVFNCKGPQYKTSLAEYALLKHFPKAIKKISNGYYPKKFNGLERIIQLFCEEIKQINDNDPITTQLILPPPEENNLFFACIIDLIEKGKITQKEISGLLRGDSFEDNLHQHLSKRQQTTSKISLETLFTLFKAYVQAGDINKAFSFYTWFIHADIFTSFFTRIPELIQAAVDSKESRMLFLLTEVGIPVEQIIMWENNNKQQLVPNMVKTFASFKSYKTNFECGKDEEIKDYVFERKNNVKTLSNLTTVAICRLALVPSSRQTLNFSHLDALIPRDKETALFSYQHMKKIDIINKNDELSNFGITILANLHARGFLPDCFWKKNIGISNKVSIQKMLQEQGNYHILSLLTHGTTLFAKKKNFSNHLIKTYEKGFTDTNILFLEDKKTEETFRKNCIKIENLLNPTNNLNDLSWPTTTENKKRLRDGQTEESYKRLKLGQ